MQGPGSEAPDVTVTGVAADPLIEEGERLIVPDEIVGDQTGLDWPVAFVRRKPHSPLQRRERLLSAVELPVGESEVSPEVGMAGRDAEPGKDHAEAFVWPAKQRTLEHHVGCGITWRLRDPITTGGDHAVALGGRRGGGVCGMLAGPLCLGDCRAQNGAERKSA